MIPIKCFTCGKVIANKYRYYKEQLSQQNKEQTTIYLTNTRNDKTFEGELLDKLGLTKYCCRRHLLTHVEI